MRKLFLIALSVLLFRISPAIADEKPVSFASFAYFIDRLQLPSKKIGIVWATPHSVYEGPFFTNDILHVYLPPDYFNEGHSPFFRGPVSAGGSSIDYYNGYGPVDPSGHVNEKFFQMIFQSEVKTGVQKISLPAFPEETAKEAAFGGFIAPKSRGSEIVLPHNDKNQLTGGIVVNGSVDALTFDAEPGENFKIVLERGKKTTIVEIDSAHQRTFIYALGEKAIGYDGIPNGAVYVDGTIGSPKGNGIKGKVKGRWTVATPLEAFIEDSITYSDTPAGSRPQGKDCLALIARSVFVTRNAPDLFFLYASVFAERAMGKDKVGTLFVLPNKDMPHVGELIWWGNYIGEYPAIMGTFDRSTGESKDGYDLHKFYDSRLANDPPPYFPVVGELEGPTEPVSRQ